MVAIAVVFDILSAAPWVGLIASGLGYLILGFIFMVKGINPIGFSNREQKKLASFASEWIAGLLGFGIWPGITVWAVITIKDSWQEDEESKEKQKSLKKEVRQRQLEHSNKSSATNSRREKTSVYQ